MPMDMLGMALEGKLKVLVANRGEIAARVIKTCKKLGIESVAIYTDVDVLSLHEIQATESVCLGSNSRAYTNGELLIKIARDKGCCGLHPGYGFLSENIEFAEACEEAGITFIGPNTDAMRIFSEKHTAKAHAVKAGVPTLSGSGLLSNVQEALEATKLVGLPVLLKATGGGGGMGIYLCRTEQDVEEHFHTAASQAQAYFGIAGVFVEKYIERAHHIEVQVFGDGKGNVIHIGERECSIQRRHQKILEETPSPLVDDTLRKELTQSAVQLCSAVNYRSAGTVEFLVDSDTRKFYFLEVNTRLQVEHGITELVNGNIDLVEWMLRLQLPVAKDADFVPVKNFLQYHHAPKGHSIEVRLCAENPLRDFMPSPGILGLVEFPQGPDIRVDSWVTTGTEVSGMYDSLIAKIMVWAQTRQGAIQAMEKALDKTQIKGIPTNLDFLQQVVASSAFKSGKTTTKFLADFSFVSHSIEVLSPGMLTTVQDYPGRVKLWHVGVPPSGPMDNQSFRLANSIVGNDENAAGLEITFRGPTLLFRCDSVVAITGASISLTLDGKAAPMWTSIHIQKGQTLVISDIIGQVGARSYLAVFGGIDVPDYLHSKSTFIGGKFGGVQGRALCKGDMLPIKALPENTKSNLSLPEQWRPDIVGKDTIWEVEVLPGPYAAPDYFTQEDIDMLYSSNFTVHYNSNRLGIRLHGPKPQWARENGGEGGSHPSNIHDYTYAIGAVNFTGDMPIVLGVDGPSLGGFVCPCVVLSTELWKMGQVRANDRISWKKVTLEHAYIKRRLNDLKMNLLREAARGEICLSFALLEFKNARFEPPRMPETTAVIKVIPSSDVHPGGQYRLAGDRFVLVEYGPVELDLNFRVRAYMLEKALHAQAIEGLVETNPGVRSLLVEYDPVVLPFPKLIDVLNTTDSLLPDAHDFECPSRIVNLPLAFNEKWTHEAIQKYSQSVRKEATYIPSNIEFIAKNNGLEGIKSVEDILFSSSYLVLGLGDVYLGACCAVPLDPRQRLVVPKYNPARVFTPEGAVGIGGCYMCIYPMESPGGYQLLGRTLSMWNTFGRVEPFNAEKPWFLDFFDQVRFFPVSEDELETIRKEFKGGKYKVKIDQGTLRMKEYNAMVASIASEIEVLKGRQRIANAEQNSLDAIILKKLAEETLHDGKDGNDVLEDEEDYHDSRFTKVDAQVSGSTWDVAVEVGQEVDEGQTLVVLEAMKMEYNINAPTKGTVKSIKVMKSDLVTQGDTLVVLEINS